MASDTAKSGSCTAHAARMHISVRVFVFLRLV